MIHITTTEKFNAAKHRFAMMKNGVLADALKQAGAPHRVVWGLNVPQLREIAADIGKDEELAWMLWEDTATRESVLLAPMVMPSGIVEEPMALEMIDAAPSVEAVDMLTHALLRHESYAWSLMQTLAGSADPVRRYAAMRLLAPLARTRAAEARPIAQAELDRADSLTRTAAANIIEEIDNL